MCYDRISKPILSDHQKLINHPTQYPRQPLKMLQSKQCRSHKKRQPMHSIERHFLKVGLHEIAINKGTPKYFFQGWNDERASQRSHSEEKPSGCGISFEFFKRIPRSSLFENQIVRGVKRIQSDPN